MGERLQGIVERIRADWTRKNEIRDTTLARSRTLIRHCANSIRATHRREWDEARRLLAEAQAEADTMRSEASAYADIYAAGYVQDALKELVEAASTLALVTGKQLPDPDEMGIGYAAYLNGLGEAVGEMRRYALDSMRRGDLTESERILDVMDEVYTYLVTMDFTDSLTGGLRRTTDMVRGVTERTRGDLTTSVRQELLGQALEQFEARLNARFPAPPGAGA
jgi:translin